MGRAPCCGKVGLNKGPWTNDEDVLLVRYVEQHGEGNWRALPKAAGLLRCGKSCRLRWINYLRPDLKRGNIAEDEEDLIIKLHSLLGNRWSLIAGRIPGRTDNEIKNYWNTHLSKKLVRKGMNHPATGPNPFHCSGNGVRSEQKQAALSAEKKDIHKRKFEDFNSNQMSDLESVSQDTHPSLLRKDRSSFPGCNMPAKSLMQHSEQPLQNVIELSDTDQDFFCSKSEIENSRRLLPTSPATISSCFVQLDYHSDSAPHNEKSSSSSLRPFSYDDITPLAEFEPSSGITSPDSISSYYSFGTVCNPTFELKDNSKHTACVFHNQGGNESLDYDHGRDSANDAVEIAQEDRSREASIENILPDLEFLDELEVDNLWDILGISPITESSNADTIENDDTYWADILMEADPSMWMYDIGCTQTADHGNEQ